MKTGKNKTSSEISRKLLLTQSFINKVINSFSKREIEMHKRYTGKNLFSIKIDNVINIKDYKKK